MSIRVNPCSSVVNFSYFTRYDIRITQYGSINIEQLCETKPISQKPKMNLTHYLTSDYDNNSDISMLEKQTQTKPICGEQG
jgi:hypothetical protein